ncbi:50S ribosomal protein L21 [Blattabacterium cuenoti]|uniref:50S ribosomal protein L21 n=1 Tax=Blattabacterium cuenoti TaxID=1653831 RepID=UPI001EEAB807|nr:50S ribosomal protein L21 [Blattabacterium cuenoti]
MNDIVNNYMIADLYGNQLKLIENKYVYIPFLSKKKLGDEFYIYKILLFYKNGLISIGNPYLNNISVKVQVLKHIKGNKIIIFKKKRRKGYKKKNGFRPIFSKIKIISFKEKK